MSDLTAKHIALLLVLLSFGIAIGWDFVAAAIGRGGDTWCDAFRDISRKTGGLAALAYLGLGIHLWLKPALIWLGWAE